MNIEPSTLDRACKDMRTLPRVFSCSLPPGGMVFDFVNTVEQDTAPSGSIWRGTRKKSHEKRGEP